MNPMVDGWMGDDWFHNGAFRQQNMSYIYEQEATRDNTAKWCTSALRRLRHVHEGGIGGRAGPEPRARAGGLLAQDAGAPELRRVLAAIRPWTRCWPASRSRCRPCSSTASGTQEDIYGAIAVYQALEPKDTANDMVFLVMGPWHHGAGDRGRQHAGRAPVREQHVALFPRQILRPFLDHYLKDGAPKADVAPVTAFETGTNTWRRLAAWPVGLRRWLHGQADAALSARRLEARLPAAQGDDAPFDEYVSDPAKPVPFRARPDSAGRLRQRTDLAALAGGRSARGIRAAGRPGVHLRRR